MHSLKWGHGLLFCRVSDGMGDRDIDLAGSTCRCYSDLLIAPFEFGQVVRAAGSAIQLLAVAMDSMGVYGCNKGQSSPDAHGPNAAI